MIFINKCTSNNTYLISVLSDKCHVIAKQRFNILTCGEKTCMIASLTKNRGFTPANSHLKSQYKTQHTPIEIKGTTWDRYKYVAGLNHSIDSKPSLLIMDLQYQ